MSVRAAYLPSRLWVIGRFTVTTDKGERFVSAQAAYNEDFRWTLNHDGVPIECHLRTTRDDKSAKELRANFRMPYELTIGDDPTSSHVIALSGAWGNLLVSLLGVVVLFAIPPAVVVMGYTWFLQ
ncbi:MAG: hypothetical protein AAGF97_11010 [Planctomycetota bacterium]